MENTPTSTPPENKQCFNCGKDLETHATFCPHCGAPLPTQGSTFLIVLRVMGAVILGIIASLFGTYGACFVLLGIAGGLNQTPSSGLGFGLIGMFLLGLTALCIWGAIKLGKRRK